MYLAKCGLGKDQNRLLLSAGRLAISVRRASFLLACRYALPSLPRLAKARQIIRMRPKTLNLAANFIKATAVCLKIAPLV